MEARRASASACLFNRAACAAPNTAAAPPQVRWPRGQTAVDAHPSRQASQPASQPHGDPRARARLRPVVAAHPSAACPAACPPACVAATAPTPAPAPTLLRPECPPRVHQRRGLPAGGAHQGAGGRGAPAGHLPRHGALGAVDGARGARGQRQGGAGGRRQEPQRGRARGVAAADGGVASGGGAARRRQGARSMGGAARASAPTARQWPQTPPAAERGRLSAAAPAPPPRPATHRAPPLWATAELRRDRPRGGPGSPKPPSRG